MHGGDRNSLLPLFQQGKRLQTQADSSGQLFFNGSTPAEEERKQQNRFFEHHGMTFGFDDADEEDADDKNADTFGDIGDIDDDYDFTQSSTLPGMELLKREFETRAHLGHYEYEDQEEHDDDDDDDLDDDEEILFSGTESMLHDASSSLLLFSPSKTSPQNRHHHHHHHEEKERESLPFDVFERQSIATINDTATNAFIGAPMMQQDKPFPLDVGSRLEVDATDHRKTTSHTHDIMRFFQQQQQQQHEQQQHEQEQIQMMQHYPMQYPVPQHPTQQAPLLTETAYQQKLHRPPPRLVLQPIATGSEGAELVVYNTYVSSPFTGYPAYRMIFGNGQYMRGDEINFIAKIQMKDLHMDNPYIDDFYFGEIAQRKAFSLAPNTVQGIDQALHDTIIAEQPTQHDEQQRSTSEVDRPRMFGRLPSQNVKGMRTIVMLEPEEFKNIKKTKSTMNTDSNVRIANDIEKGTLLLLQIKDVRVSLAVKPANEHLKRRLDDLTGRLLHILKLTDPNKHTSYLAELCRRTKGIKFIAKCLRELTEPHRSLLVDSCSSNWDAISASAYGQQGGLEEWEMVERLGLLEMIRQSLIAARQ